MKQIIKFLLMSIVLSMGLTACGNDGNDEIDFKPSVNSGKVTAPAFDKFLSTTDYDSFSVRVRFKTGGDKESNLNATVHWMSYPSRPSSPPSKNDLTKVESMRQYGSAIYHNTGSKKGMTESIVFDKSHAGFRGGTYIYYYVECRNSVGAATSSIDYKIIKR